MHIDAFINSSAASLPRQASPGDLCNRFAVGVCRFKAFKPDRVEAYCMSHPIVDKEGLCFFSAIEAASLQSRKEETASQQVGALHLASGRRGLADSPKALRERVGGRPATSEYSTTRQSSMGEDLAVRPQSRPEFFHFQQYSIRDYFVSLV